MENVKVANSDGWYVYKSSDDDGLFMPEMWDWESLNDFPLVQQELKVIYSLLEMLIRSQATEYGYYFSESHETDEPSDLQKPTIRGVWSTVYDTPASYYNQAHEYHHISTSYSKEFTYYGISLRGCSFSSALTEYVRIRNETL